VTIRGAIAFLDPQDDLYPHCVCDKGVHPCEHPCWMRPGLDSDFDQADPNGCCCRMYHRQTGHRMCDWNGCEDPACMIVTVKVGKQRNDWPKRTLCAKHGGLTIETGRVSSKVVPISEGKLHATNVVA
jgi:hypothetical protein